MSKHNFYRVSASNFVKIPGTPIAYWVGEKIASLFNQLRIESFVLKVCKGGYTGDNEKFLRLWSEVSIDSIIKDDWHYYSKGGAFRKWYGNLEYVILWRNNGNEVKKSPSSGMGASKFYGMPHIVWSKISTYKPSFRCDASDIYFDDASPSMVFSQNLDLRYYMCGYSNSIIVEKLLALINPTFNFQSGDIKSLPLKVENDEITKVTSLVQQNISLSRTDWDSFETSWDFKTHPLVRLARKRA